jgi:hypothetical protein
MDDAGENGGRMSALVIVLEEKKGRKEERSNN